MRVCKIAHGQKRKFGIVITRVALIAPCYSTKSYYWVAALTTADVYAWADSALTIRHSVTIQQHQLFPLCLLHPRPLCGL